MEMALGPYDRGVASTCLLLSTHKYIHKKPKSNKTMVAIITDKEVVAY